jgi:hypothetical protein
LQLSQEECRDGKASNMNIRKEWKKIIPEEVPNCISREIGEFDTNK